VDPVFAYGEFGLMNMRRNDAWNYSNDIRVTEEQIYVGLGYLEQLTDRIFAQTLILYSVNETAYYPLENIVFRVGFELHLD